VAKVKGKTKVWKQLASVSNLPNFEIKNLIQGRRSHVKSEGAQGGYFFLCNFLLLFWAIWKNDLFSKSQKVGGLKPPLPPLVRRPCFTG